MFDKEWDEHKHKFDVWARQEENYLEGEYISVMWDEFMEFCWEKYKKKFILTEK